MFNFVEYLIGVGVPQESLYLILSLPFVALIVSFLRYFVGLKTLGVYESIVLAYVLYILSPNFLEGLKFGAILFIFIVFVSEVSRRLLKKTHLHFMAKTSINVGITTLAYIVFLSILGYLGKTAFLQVSPLAVIVLVLLIDSVNVFRVKFGDRKTTFINLETLTISVLAYFFLSSSWAKDVLIGYPYVVIIPLVLGFVVGRYQGLQFSEYLRFNSMFKND